MIAANWNDNNTGNSSFLSPTRNFPLSAGYHAIKNHAISCTARWGPFGERRTASRGSRGREEPVCGRRSEEYPSWFEAMQRAGLSARHFHALGRKGRPPRCRPGDGRHRKVSLCSGAAIQFCEYTGFVNTLLCRFRSFVLPERLSRTSTVFPVGGRSFLRKASFPNPANQLIANAWK